MHTLQINFLIQFLASSTCFEHHVFIIRKTVCTSIFCMVCFSCIYVSIIAGGMMCSMSSILRTVDWPCQLTSPGRFSGVHWWRCLSAAVLRAVDVSHLPVVATYFFDLCTTWMGLLWYKFVACKNGHVRGREIVVYETAVKRKSERGHAVINLTSKVSESSRVVCYEEDPADGPYLYLCC